MDNPSSFAAMALHLRTPLLGIVLTCAAPRVGHAGCTLKPDDSDFNFSAAALEARDSFFASVCDESFAELVMFPDPRLKERLSPPSQRRPLVAGSLYPDPAGRLGLEGSPVVAYVVEADGVVKHAIVIQSGGHQALDEAAVDYSKQFRFDAPGTLDGLPVRVLSTNQLIFKLLGPGARLPAAFTDEIIVKLGNRMVDFCNRGDVDTLYEALDETAKHKISRTDIRQQLRVYNGLYGEITLARYEGLLSAEIKHGVPVYEMAYALDLERPGDENVVLDVTVADRLEGPRVMSFWMDRKIVIHRPHRGGGAP
jgi:TonB family protein